MYERLLEDCNSELEEQREVTNAIEVFLIYLEICLQKIPGTFQTIAQSKSNIEKSIRDCNYKT